MDFIWNSIFDGWCDFLNYFDSSIKFQFSFVNLTALRESFARAIPLRSDQFESIQRELSKIIEEQQAKGNNGIVKTKYLTFGIDADNIRSAKPRLERIETDILNNFKRLGVNAEVQNGQQRLRVLHDILRMDTPEPFVFHWEDLPRSGLSTKDYIAPSSFLFNRAKDFRMGRKFASVSFLQILAPELSDRILNSKKVSDHHAILPTMAAGELDSSSLPTAEQNILKLISRQVLMAVSGAYRYREAEITITCGEPFKTTMKMLLDAGWKKYSQKGTSQKWFSGLEVGQVLSPSKVSVKDGKTQPPHHYTEDLLLSSMETAGAKDMPEDAERKGLGTPATRAGILEKLVSTGMLERRKVKKQTILVPTELGNALITVLPEQLQSPLLTAEWENRLSQVQKGELEPEEFLDGIQGMLTDLVADHRPVSSADILFPSAENTVGKCPRCGRPVIERSKGYFCTGQDCKFVLWRDSRFFTLKQKTLDRKTAQLLLETGRAPLKGCVSSKTGKVYDAAVVLEDDGERAHFKLVFGNG